MKRRSLVVRLWVGAAVLLAGLPLLPLVGIQAAAPGITPVAKIPVMWPADDPNVRGLTGNGSLILNPAARRGYQVFRLAGSQTHIQAIDLDSLQPVGTARLPGHPAPGSAGANIGEFVNAVDPDGDRVYLPYQSGGTFGGVFEIDGRTAQPLRTLTRTAAFQPEVDPEDNPCTAVSCLPTPPGINPEIRGMSFVSAIDSPASRDKLLLLLQDRSGPASGSQVLVWVAQWDVGTGKQDWIYRVAACSSRRLPDDPFSRYQTALFQSPGLPYIYLGCFGSGGTGMAVRLEQDGTGQPAAETSFPGPLGLVDVLGDPSANRLFLKIVNDEGESYWVFDGPSTSYVGVIGTTLGPSHAGAGIDPDSGRLYVQAPPSAARNRSDPGGLFVADARRSPAPQAIVFRDFKLPAVQKIQVDPATDDRARRVFVLPQDGDAYLVLRDDVEVSVDPPLSDQDRFTTDTEEVIGVTGVNFTGTAHGYGLRTVLVGGLEGTSPTRGTAVGSPLLFVGSPCMKPDREVVLGRVRSAALSNSLASATTIAGDAEATTRTDLQEPANRCNSRGLVTGFDALADTVIGPVVRQADAAVGQQWPFEEAECAGDTQTRQEAANLGGYTANSICKQSGEQVTAAASGEALRAGPLAAAHAYSTVRLVRKPGEGLRVRAESWVRGITVDGAFSIDAARTVAEAFAAGRPGTAGTTFAREICGIRIAGTAIGQPEDLFLEGCYDPFDQIEAVGEQTIVNNAVTDRPIVFALNRALGTRGRIRVPDPDEDLKKGTPGGYLASLQKNRGEEIQARVISNDASTEVPAFELIMFNDDQSAGRARQLYQFAGVDASATYGIFLPPTLDLGDAVGDTVDVEPLSVPNMLTELTGGFPGGGITPTTAVESSGPANVIAQAVNRVARSLSLFMRSPREAVLASAVWLLLGLPFYLAARRRALLARRTM